LQGRAEKKREREREKRGGKVGEGLKNLNLKKFD